MMITRDNYEPFFLDYLEGNLAENILDQFLDFLGQNPDLKEELHLFENVHLPEEQAVYQDKAHLYKSVQDEKSAFEIKSIAFMEGDLNDEERKLFEAYLTNHTELQKEYNLFAKTRLVADPSINYQDKQKLYRRSGTATVMNWVARVAAVVAIVWGISSLFQTGNRPDRPTTVHEITAAKPQPAAPVIKVEPKRPNPEIAEKPIDRANPKQSSIREEPKVEPVRQTKTETNSPERNLIALTEITTIEAKLEVHPVETKLIVSNSFNVPENNESQNNMSLEGFLTSQVKRVGDQGLLSAQRILRSGLSAVSELSGDRIGYSVQEGKVSSLEFESRLIAFSIPLQKK